MDRLVVTYDVRKLGAITVSYLLIATCVVALAMTQSSNVVLLVICLALAAVMVAASGDSIRKMRQRATLLALDEKGVTDFSKPHDIVSLPWDQVTSVQLKAANTNDLMLDVVGYKTIEQLDDITPQMRVQLDQTDGNRVYLLLELSGLWVRRARIREAFDWIREHVGDAYPGIQFNEFKDPLSKLGVSKDEG